MSYTDNGQRQQESWQWFKLGDFLFKSQSFQGVRKGERLKLGDFYWNTKAKPSRLRCLGGIVLIKHSL